ncbi:MAG: diguanylate cyclase domain-containing protein [Acidobacteriaceae bacterium]
MPVENDAEIFRAVLDVMDLGVYIVDLERRITFWNTGAERITGYSRTEVMGRPCRENILVQGGENGPTVCSLACPMQLTLQDGLERQEKMYLRHKQGYRVPVHVKTSALRDGNGHRMAGVECFTEGWLAGDGKTGAEGKTALHGQERPSVARPREHMEAYLERGLGVLEREGQSFGVLVVQVDQWRDLRKTHGKEAADSMMHVVEETLLYTLGPTDVLGLWDEDKFLVVARDASVRALELDAELLRGVAASAQFRWWGDRLPLTVSVGGGLALPGDTSQGLMARAHSALEQCLAHGGNSVTVAETNSVERASSEV